MIDALDIKFGASAPGLDGQVRDVVSNIHNIRDAVDALSGFLDGLKTGIREALNPPPNDLEKELREAREQADGLGDELEQADRKARGLGDSLTSVSGGIKGAIGGLIAGLSLQQVMSWADANASAAEQINNLTQRLAIGSRELQGWRAVVGAAGGNVEGFSGAITKLELNMFKAADGTGVQADALRALGISAEAARNPNEALLQIADRFSGMEDGPQKVALAMTLMGRAGAEQIPLLNQGREAIEAQMAAAEQYGVVLDESMLAKAAAVDEALDSNAMALKGISNTIFAESAPAILALVDGFNDFVAAGMESYRTGGIVASVFGFIGETIKVLIVGLVAVGTTIYALFESINGFCWELDAITRETFERVRVSFELGVAGAMVFARALYDLTTFNWDDLASNAEAGMARIAAAAEMAAGRVAAAGAASRQAVADSEGRVQSARSGLLDFAGNMRGGGGSVGNIFGTSDPGALVSGGRGGADFALGGAGGGGGGRGGGGAARDTRMQDWTEELQRMQVASGEFFRDQTTAELEFWGQKLALTRQGTDAYHDVQQRIFNLSRTQAQQTYQEQLSVLNATMQSQRDNQQMVAALAEERLALVRRTYGEESREYRTALRERNQLAEQHQRELVQIEQRGMQQRLQMAEEAERADLAVTQAGARDALSQIAYLEGADLLGRREAAAQRASIAQQEFAARAASEERLFQMKADSLRAQLQLEGMRPAEAARINADIERLEAAHSNRMRVLATQQATLVSQAQISAANATRQVWLDRLAPVSSALTSMVNGFLTGTQSMRSAVLQMGSQMLQAVNKWIIDWVTTHVAGEQARTAATVAGDTARTASTVSASAAGLAASTTTATAQITTNAAVGASGALASISSIPVIGPFIAPAIAAGILALAMGFVSKIASAEGGWGQVPYDGAMTELHKDEMVLPASIASPLRDALSNRESTWSLGATGLAARQMDASDVSTPTREQQVRRDGDLHLHVSAIDTQTGVQWIQRNKRAITQAVRQAHREGTRG